MREPFTSLYVHVVWATWDRLPLIVPDLEAILYPCLQAETKRRGGQPIAIGGVADHVHVLARLPTTLSIANLVKQLKGSSSHLLGGRSEDSFFKWQGGYGAFTVSRWDVPRVMHYVRHQKHHHREGTLSATLERVGTR